jgi:hypothetical protein
MAIELLVCTALTIAVVEFDIGPPRNELFECLVGPGNKHDLLMPAWQWYIHFLDCRIREIWTTLLFPVIPDISCSVAEPDSRELARVYEVIVVIAKAIKMQKEVSLEKIVTKLKDDGLVKADAEATTIRMAFALIGWLTMLFDPKTESADGLLQLRKHTSGRAGRGRSRGAVISCFSKGISQGGESMHEMLFHRMLGHFGSLFPEAPRSPFSDSMLSPGLTGSDNYLTVSYICFNTLRNVGSLRIEWVNTLNLHLQLDVRERVLRLFRFPSFCWLLHEGYYDLSSSEDGGQLVASFLSQMFADYDADHKKSLLKGDPEDQDVAFPEFCREVLLSYRLIFGIDSRSRRAFHSEEISKWKVDRTNDTRSIREHKLDPLLQLLCTAPANRPELQGVLERLGGEETDASVGYAPEHFPFLGQRLADLQRFSMSQKPYDWKSVLWRDRRDARNWWLMWTAWAVLVIGGGTLVLQFLQLLFQIRSTFHP